MEVDMETSPSYFDPEDLSSRERFRRYGKRHPGSSLSPHHDNSAPRFSNAALFLENIKNEVESLDTDVGGTPFESISRRRTSIDSHGASRFDSAADAMRRRGSESLKVCKQEEHEQVESGDTTFSLFASLLDSGLQGLMPIPDLILQFESSCRNVSESIRYGANERYRVVEDRLMRQKARLLLDEAASWSLLWYLYGKGNEELPENLILQPLYAIFMVLLVLFLRRHIGCVYKLRSEDLMWALTSQALEFGIILNGILKEKQDESLLEDIWTLLRAGRLEEACNLCRSAGQPWRAASLCPFVGLNLFPSLEALERNGKNRMLQAIELESGIGHQWRLWKWASYCASEKIAEQDGGKYEGAVYAAQCSNLKRLLPVCTDWESACWAMAKSWLDVQVDIAVARLRPGEWINSRVLKKQLREVQGKETLLLSQQVDQIVGHFNDTVHEAVTRACKEQQRQIEMNLMVGDIPHLLDLIFSWISPSEDDENIFRPHGDPQMMRFGAHLVLVLRYLLADQMKDTFREKIMTVGDFIIHMYAMFLFTKQHEELVGIYASQLARHRCIDLFVHMMELRLNSSVHVRYKIFLSAVEYLPFSPEDDTKGSFEEIIERTTSSAELTESYGYSVALFTPPSTINDAKAVTGKLVLRALMHSNILFREFALISMWRVPAIPIGAHTVLSLLAEPLKQPTEILLSTEDNDVSENLREFQDWSEYYSCDAKYRNWLKIQLTNAEVSPRELSGEEKQSEVTAAGETLRSSLLLLKEKIALGWFRLKIIYMNRLNLYTWNCMLQLFCVFLLVNVSISSRDSSCIEVVLRCLAVDGDGLGPHDLNDGGILASVMAAGFKGELARFQAGVTMEISRLDAWYSSSDGSLEGPATYIVRGLCRKCCIPEIFLRCMQVSVSLMEYGYPPDVHQELIELVTSPETDFLHLFSQHQLQELLLFERDYSIYELDLEELPSS
ncbi:UNVERIFIED_CONTAM: Nuclear pore complex protein [Sesamum calycinum]|uniref:Nuclear pore complex protein n=1 Tax=Sesamum calycinum TaxID=2727403 RepID=A0AAW2SZJ6_9LAMI